MRVGKEGRGYLEGDGTRVRRVGGLMRSCDRLLGERREGKACKPGTINLSAWVDIQHVTVHTQPMRRPNIIRVHSGKNTH